MIHERFFNDEPNLHENAERSFILLLKLNFTSSIENNFNSRVLNHFFNTVYFL